MQSRLNPLPVFLLGACSLSVQAIGLPDPLEAGWKGEKVCENLHEDAHHRILRCTFPPGVGHEKHYHPPHFGYVVAGGTLSITDATGTYTSELENGQGFASEGVEWHIGVNVGETTVIYLMVEPKAAAD